MVCHACATRQATTCNIRSSLRRQQRTRRDCTQPTERRRHVRVATCLPSIRHWRRSSSTTTIGHSRLLREPMVAALPPNVPTIRRQQHSPAPTQNNANCHAKNIYLFVCFQIVSTHQFSDCMRAERRQRSLGQTRQHLRHDDRRTCR